jgi:hypothetical protein
MQQIRRAALASAHPSSSDRATAARAATKEARARQQLSDERAARAKGAASGD